MKSIFRLNDNVISGTFPNSYMEDNLAELKVVKIIILFGHH